MKKMKLVYSHEAYQQIMILHPEIKKEIKVTLYYL